MLDHSQFNCQDFPPVEEKLLLPSMTVAFINCLPSEKSPAVKPKPGDPAIPTKSRAISLVPLDVISEFDSTPSSGTIKGPRAPDSRDLTGRLSEASGPPLHVIVRHLIQSISHHFNNLLMGIWGNITLLKMGYTNNHPVCLHLVQMEKLIESGAFLTHMVLGYLGERRTVTRRLRLDQIVQELFEATGNDPDCLDRFRLKKRLKYAATIQHPHMIASSTGKVLDILLRRLGQHRLELGALDLDMPEVKRKVDHIDTLMTNGKQLVSQLLLYAGERKPQLLPTPFRPVIADVLHHLAPAFVDLETILQPIPSPCTMLMDRALASSALREIVAYLLDDAPDQTGSPIFYPGQTSPLRIAFRPDPSQLFVVVHVPSHRRSARFWRTQDTPGPFWENPQGNNNKSLALAAAGAVIKAHGGFIQQDIKNQSDLGFQIHLPLMSGE